MSDSNQSRCATWLLLASLLGCGCTADITGQGPGSSGMTAAGVGGGSVAPSATGVPGDVGSPPKVPGPPLVESAGIMPLLRLTHREYSNTMADLLGDSTRPGAEFETDIPGQAGYDAPSMVATENARQYMQTAESLATAAVTAGKLSIPCQSPADAASETACTSQLIAAFGAKAYRRPLVQGESDDLLALFKTAKTLGFDLQAAVSHTIEAMLQSPNLLYHWELGDQPLAHDPENAALVALTPMQLASRLSYFLSESMPDADLLAAAQSGQLSTPDALKTQALRLLADDTRARRALFNFHRQWLKVDNLEDLLPGSDLGLQLGQELEALLSSVFVSGDGSLKSLLTAPYTYVNQATAPEYGLSASGAGFTQVQLNPVERQGVLMQIPFLRTNGVAPPVARGLVVFRQLLCGTVPPPPGNAPEVGKPEPTTTTRERFAVHAEQACAKGCHELFDPWGFAFENFDQIGHFRSEESGKPVDASGLPQPDGTVGGTTPNGTVIPFKNGTELVNALAANDEVSWCTSRQWTRYLLGRLEGDADVGALTNAYVSAAFAQDRATARPFSVRDFLVSLVGSKAFRFRTPAVGETP